MLSAFFWSVDDCEAAKKGGSALEIVPRKSYQFLTNEISINFSRGVALGFQSHMRFTHLLRLRGLFIEYRVVLYQVSVFTLVIGSKYQVQCKKWFMQSFMQSQLLRKSQVWLDHKVLLLFFQYDFLYDFNISTCCRVLKAYSHFRFIT